MTAFIRTQLGVFLLIVTATSLIASDWPQWRGPERNGISSESGLLQAWPEGGPELLWHRMDVGSGYATPAVVGDQIYLISNEGLENEFVQALSITDGEQVWSQHLGKVGNPTQKPNFPAARSTPTVEGNFLYALGSDGDLACIERQSGRVIWRRSFRSDFNGQPGDWAYAESPLIHGNALVCTPGGSEATLVGLNKKNGDVIWKCAVPEGPRAAFASPILMEVDGVQQYVQLVEKGLVGVEPETGKLLWQFGKAVSRYGANIPTPLKYGPYVYWASAGTGAGLVEVKVQNGKIKATEVYSQVKLPAAIGGVVKVGPYLYGAGGQTFMCVDFLTGNIEWEERVPSPASVCYADQRLYLHFENGDVGLVEPSPDGFRSKGRFTPPDRPARKSGMERAWAYPVVAGGRLYLRDHGVLWCYDVSRDRRGN